MTWLGGWTERLGARRTGSFATAASRRLLRYKLPGGMSESVMRRGLRRIAVMPLACHPALIVRPHGGVFGMSKPGHAAPTVEDWIKAK